MNNTNKTRRSSRVGSAPLNEICRLLLLASFLLALLFQGDVYAFTSSPYNTVISKKGLADHTRITRAAILGEPVADTELRTTGFLQAELGIDPNTIDEPVNSAINRIVDCNVSQDSLSVEYRAADHFDSETFEESRSRLIYRWSSLLVEIDHTNYVEAQRELGRALHAIQDFYAHSSWLESTLASGATCASLRPEDNGMWPSWSTDIAQASDVTCDVLSLNGPILLVPQQLLTSGFFAPHYLLAPAGSPLNTDLYTPDGKLVPFGKCRHGGVTDALSRALYGNGINKDSQASPGHLEAADLARQSSIEFLVSLAGRLRRDYPEEADKRLRKLFGLNNVIRFWGTGAEKAYQYIHQERIGVLITNQLGFIVPGTCDSKVYDLDGNAYCQEIRASPIIGGNGPGYINIAEGLATPSQVTLSAKLYPWNPSGLSEALNSPLVSDSFLVAGSPGNRLAIHDFDISDKVESGASYLLVMETGSLVPGGQFLSQHYRFRAPAGVKIEGLDGGVYDSATRSALGCFFQVEPVTFYIVTYYDMRGRGSPSGIPFFNKWYGTLDLSGGFSRDSYRGGTKGTKQRWKITFPSGKPNALPRFTKALAQLSQSAPPWIQDISFYELNPNAVHPDYFPVSHAPIVGKTNILRVTLGGDYVAARVEMTNFFGGRQALLGMTNSDRGNRLEFSGPIVVPAEPFRLRVRALDANGVQYSLLSDDIYPTGLMFEAPARKEFEEGKVINLVFPVANTGLAADFQFSAWSENSAHASIISVNPTSATLATDQTTNITVAVRATNLVSISTNGVIYEDTITTTLAASSAQSIGNSLSVEMPVRHPQVLLGAPITDPTNFIQGTSSIRGPNDYDVVAVGSGFKNSSDQIYFQFQALSGDFDATVQIASFSGGSASADAALMFRESLDATSPTVAVSARNPVGGNKYTTILRATKSGIVEKWPTANEIQGVRVPNAWLRLVRKGDLFTAYSGTDGVNWTLLGDLKTQMPCFGFLGLATSSGTNSSGPTSLSYRSVQFSDHFPPEILAQPKDTKTSAGSAVVLAADACSNRPLGFQWYFNGAPLSGQNLPTLVINNISAAELGKYSLLISNSFGATTSQAAEVSFSKSALPLLINPTVNGGQFEVFVDGEENATYAIETSTNLTDWTVTGTITLTHQMSLFSVPLVQNGQKRFYRAKLTQ